MFTGYSYPFDQLIVGIDFSGKSRAMPIASSGHEGGFRTNQSGTLGRSGYSLIGSELRM